MLDFATADQRTLKRFVDRRHPSYRVSVAHWVFLDQSYHGGREWFTGNIFRYHREGDTEFGNRVNRAYRFNHTKEVVDLINKYIFKGDIVRNVEDAPECIKRFWQRATLSGRSIDQLMWVASQKASIFGRVWMVVDTTVTESVQTLAEEKTAGAAVYAYVLTPLQVLDLSYDEHGKLNWALIHEIKRDDADPLASTGAIKSRFRLWTRTNWFLFEMIARANKQVIELIGQGDNAIGEVPLFSVDHVHSDDPYSAAALIGDIAYLDRAVANYLSNLDAIIQDQTFSQLCIPGQALMPGEEGYDKMMEMGTKRIFTYDGEHGHQPQYISPDPKQAGVILAVVNKIIGEIYHSVGLAGERTKQDNAVGIDNSSGVAKAYDFERVNALLAAKADALDTAENRLVRLVKLYSGERSGEDDPDLVKYPDNFDVRGLYDEFEIAERLALLEAPEELRRLQMLSVIEKLYPRLSKELVEKLKSAVEQWPPQLAEIMPALSKREGAEALGSLTKVSKNNQQGQVGEGTKNIT